MMRKQQLIGVMCIAVALWCVALLPPKPAQAPVATVYDRAYPIPGTGVTVGYPSRGFFGDGVKLGYSDAVSFSSLNLRGHLYVMSPPLSDPSVQVAVYETEGHAELSSFIAMLEERQMPGISAAGRYTLVNGRQYFLWADDGGRTAITIAHGEAVVVTVQSATGVDAMLRDVLLNIDFDCREHCTVGEMVPTFIGKGRETEPGWRTSVSDRCRVAVPHPAGWVNASYLGGIDLRSPEDVRRNEAYDLAHPESQEYQGEGGALGLRARRLFVDCYTDAASFIGGFEGFLVRPELATRMTLAEFFADGPVKIGTGIMEVVSTVQIDGQTAYEVHEVHYSPHDGSRNDIYSLLVEKGRMYSFELDHTPFAVKDELLQRVVMGAYFLQ